MSLRDLLPAGTYDEIIAEAKSQDSASHKNQSREEGKLAPSHQKELPSGTTTAAQNPPLSGHCPICKQKVALDSSNPFRPFCSERCRLLDLGAWANNERALPGKSVYEDEDAEQAAEISLSTASSHYPQNDQ